MKIRVEVTIEDIVALSHYHWDHSPSYRRSRLTVRLILSMGAFVVCAAFALIIDSPEFLIVGGVAAIVLFLFVSVGHRDAVEKSIRKAYGEGANEDTIGWHEYEITSDSLIERTINQESQVKWTGIERIVSTNMHTFMYNGALTAYVIPRSELSEADYCAFVQLAKNEWKKNRPATN